MMLCLQEVNMNKALRRPYMSVLLSALLKGRSVSAKFSRRRGRTTRTIFAQIDRPINALNFVADSIHTEKLRTRLFFK